ncbi:hypothetical protein JR316_0006613 [Psilocybe cubensis]|uniref:Uncharacterized protein n=2 Tax=Psilocybe cubensis TaxID=181762 RepID=A0A8H7XLC1_PSICU|nr:hypothetical protein JR316_0006613 [Psilocybe cubensis]KAH9480016.1 hypothetical protein JR316_0006613 [Psilocybe cubensis]
MHALQFIVSFLALGTLSGYAIPSPEPKSSRQVPSIVGTLNTLQKQTSFILPEIKSIVASGVATKSSISPLIASVVSNANTAHTSLALVTSPAPTDTDAEAAAAIVAIIGQISSTLQGALVIPGLDDLIDELGLDPALSQIISGVDGVLLGVTDGIAQLFRDAGFPDVANFLDDLSLDLTLLALGIVV